MIIYYAMHHRKIQYHRVLMVRMGDMKHSSCFYLAKFEIINFDAFEK
jgi:hypothetical protein